MSVICRNVLRKTSFSAGFEMDQLSEPPGNQSCKILFLACGHALVITSELYERLHLTLTPRAEKHRHGGVLQVFQLHGRVQHALLALHPFPPRKCSLQLTRTCYNLPTRQSSWL
ncbi:hypothetical protein AMECASPLE_030667 [Ameca splendens]|uniref:Uncharacterized protein n=1 Tax=Ameca splendens TaxID=208324 RepID=A0ABV0XV00_9TELE